LRKEEVSESFFIASAYGVGLAAETFISLVGQWLALQQLQLRLGQKSLQGHIPPVLLPSLAWPVFSMPLASFLAQQRLQLPPTVHRSNHSDICSQAIRLKLARMFLAGFLLLVLGQILRG
jgi:hypothetical protein